MTTQQQADIALAEHRAVMAALISGCVRRPTEQQYEDQLTALRGALARHEKDGGPDAAD